MGVPAATVPTHGTPMTWLCLFSGMAKAIVLWVDGLEMRYPLSISVLTCEWTVEVELRPTAAPISRIVGG